jgi:hypothetical protein
MLIIRLLPLLAILSSAGCQADVEKSGAADDASQHILTDKKPVAERPDMNPVGPGTEQIDPPPITRSQSSIVSQSDIQVNGKPACDFVIRYPDAIDQNVTWNDEPCKNISARFIPVAELQRAGQLDDVSEEAKADLLRLPGEQVFYIQSEFTASAFPLNVARVIYEISLAD